MPVFTTCPRTWSYESKRTIRFTIFGKLILALKDSARTGCNARSFLSSLPCTFSSFRAVRVLFSLSDLLSDPCVCRGRACPGNKFLSREYLPCRGGYIKSVNASSWASSYSLWAGGGRLSFPPFVLYARVNMQSQWGFSFSCLPRARSGRGEY